MLLRKAERSDDAALLALFHESIHGLGPEHYRPEELAAWSPQNQEPDWAKWRKRLQPLISLTAWDGETLLGFLSYELDGHIDFLYTAPQAARKGVASALLLKAEQELQAAGVGRYFTEASLVAKGFFAHHGYRVDAEELVQRGEVLLRRYRMRK